MFFKNVGSLLVSLFVFINKLISAFKKFGKSSYLSLLFLAVILVLVQSLDQANTLLVDMLEVDKWSLMFCFAVISIFAAVLSHYPRYIYYAENINDSRDDHQWYAYKWFGYALFTFSKIDGNYQQDYKAKYFRHCLGLVIYIIWHYYIYQTFYPKFVVGGENMIELAKTVMFVFSIVPAIILIFLLDAFDTFQSGLNNASSTATKTVIKQKRRKYYTLGVTTLLIVIALVIILGLCIVIFSAFNMNGYLLLQTFTFVLAIMYVLFRVFRVYVRVPYPRLRFISNSVGYLRFYFVCALVLILFLIYSNIAVLLDWQQANAMLILLSVFFIIYYTIACLLKYFFMISIFRVQKDALIKNQKVTPKGYLNNADIDKKNRKHLVPLGKQEAFSKRRGLIGSLITIITIVLCIISYFSEAGIHELEVYDTVHGEDVVSIDAFKDKLKERTDLPFFYVASHGGGLKANIWTMKVLNEIQEKSKGRFLNQTVSFSGASGGMMGLSLYSILYGQFGDDYKGAGARINKVAQENFASKDIAFTFGADLIRKLYPFSKIGTYRDRSYYSMVTYRNILENKSLKLLDSLSFKAYWKKNVFNNKNQYFPSLIVNTAKTNGKRGVFYSIDYPKDDNIFLNSDKLSQLHNGSIAYYEAISSTNRFPALSPAAKIKSYGHYIDAGAIDNSGLLSSLDLYNYLKKDTILANKRTVFVEIMNGRSNYIRYLIRKFKKEKGVFNFEIEEKEQDNIVADLKTGLNLDKIPNYLSDFLESWSEKDSLITYVPVYLPFQISLKEVENYIGGELDDSSKVYHELDYFLKIENAKVKRGIKDDGHVWETYEPTLARHLSKSTIEYYDRVIEGQLITKPIEVINKMLKH